MDRTMRADLSDDFNQALDQQMSGEKIAADDD